MMVKYRTFSYFHLTFSEMQEYGITLVENVPTDMSGLPKLVKTIFGPEPNHYGDYFKVETKPDANNIAYTGAKIGLHQDLPYYEKTPSVTMKYQIDMFKRKK